MSYWTGRGAPAAVACTGVQLSTYFGQFVFFPDVKVWIVVWTVVAVTTVACVVMVHIPFAKFVFALTLAPISAVIWVWVQFLNGTANEFYALYNFQAGAFLFILSVLGLVITLAAPARSGS